MAYPSDSEPRVGVELVKGDRVDWCQLRPIRHGDKCGLVSGKFGPEHRQQPFAFGGE